MLQENNDGSLVSVSDKQICLRGREVQRHHSAAGGVDWTMWTQQFRVRQQLLGWSTGGASGESSQSSSRTFQQTNDLRTTGSQYKLSNTSLSLSFPF